MPAAPVARAFRDGARLSPEENQFSEMVCIGVAPAEAARLSGVGVSVADVMKRPAVLAAIRSRSAVMLHGQCVPVAMRTLVRVMEDDLSSPAARVSAARVALGAAGWLGAGAKSPEPPNASPGDAPEHAGSATGDELRQLLGQLAAMKERLDRAEPIDVTPIPSPIDI